MDGTWSYGRIHVQSEEASRVEPSGRAEADSQSEEAIRAEPSGQAEAGGRSEAVAGATELGQWSWGNGVGF